MILSTSRQFGLVELLGDLGVEEIALGSDFDFSQAQCLEHCILSPQFIASVVGPSRGFLCDGLGLDQGN